MAFLRILLRALLLVSQLQLISGQLPTLSCLEAQAAKPMEGNQVKKWVGVPQSFHTRKSQRTAGEPMGSATTEEPDPNLPSHNFQLRGEVGTHSGKLLTG